MLTIQQNVSRIIMMQISAAIIEKSIFTLSRPILHITAQKGLQTHVFKVNDHQWTILELTTCVPGMLCKF